jgi:hypothetical protein
LLFRFLDAIIDLAEEFEEALGVDLAEFEKERMMPYVSSIERIAREKGRAEGNEDKAEGKIEGLAEGMIEGMAAAKVESLLRLLAKRFTSAVPRNLEDRIRSTNDLAKLDEWFNAGFDASDLAGFCRICGI